ncbi:hypothetical protein [Arsenicicoccus sp. oral taxon 190]|uniref:hypothetical protein n=1 Tax=Arsenicicoccus sp. oral taxon 190 TaxID=1658671 RepID=UPI000679EBDC|nr:hypothetical protein [Arsenicicoccus sp. oral taxon 190]AKT51826.1 hypothetical protein ADJ73_12050 [Arsenicicoccus sp. oral taxon 190]
MDEDLERVLQSAARLQLLVPDAVLVGGSAAAYYAGHRASYDHDHVLPDLAERYGAVLDAVEASDGWATSVRASSPPFTILGTLDGVEAGLRQLRRSRALEVAVVEIAGGQRLTVPTIEETLRVKAYLVVQRNQTRDYLDVVALAEAMGSERAVRTLLGIDDYYMDRSGEPGAVSTIVAQRLAQPDPRDTRTIRELPRYKGLVPRWHDWSVVERACGELATAMLERGA